MTNRAHGLAFPEQTLFQAERGFTMQLVDGSQIEGYVRRIDAAAAVESVAYVKTLKKSPPMSPGKGKIHYGYACIRNAQGNYRIHSKNPMVIKKLSKNWLRHHPEECVMREIYIAKELGDDVHIARTHETLEDDMYYYIIMPRLGRDLIDTRKLFTLCYPTITNRLIRNLCHLKDLGILHCDISAENVISYLDTDGRTKCPFIDFAMARKCATDANGRSLRVIRETPPKPLGKLRYMSPEILYGCDLYFGVDMWAIGCLLFFLWTGNFLYLAPGDACWNFFVLRHETLPRHPRVTYILNLWENRLTEDQRDLLLQILQPQWEERATPEEILNHPYLQNYN
jgi:serine/threonine protein kinase